MPFKRVDSVAFQGLDPLVVEVEVDVTKSDEFTLIMVGLPSIAVRESKDRVLAALKNTNNELGIIRSTVNLAPAGIKKDGAYYDLPIACALWHAARNSSDNLSDYLVVGELGLNGEVRPIRGALAVAMLARKLGKTGVLLPAANAKEAAAVPDVQVIAIEHLNQALQFFRQKSTELNVSHTISDKLFALEKPAVDFSDIKGQEHVKRAMEVAAAGAHNVVLFGPPGTGKTMFAKALLGIMPELTVEEALEVTKIHSIAGLLPAEKSLVTERPFRAPHHTVSYAGLIGGGTFPRPGEVTLANHGVLFLDEFPEFSRSVLEVLRQPLEDRIVTISRANGNYTYPTNFMCIAAMNPCPCGYLGHPDKPCRDTEIQVARYRGKISGPLWDRMDMHIEVPTLRYHDMLSGKSGESSKNIRERIRRARAIQRKRYGQVKTNAEMSSADMKAYAVLDNEGKSVLRQAIDSMGMSARACDRLIRVARTIADLDNSENVKQDHLMEALAFRDK